MPSPLILVNLKTYKEGTGNRAHMIAQAAELVARESGVTIGIAPTYIDLHPISPPLRHTGLCPARGRVSNPVQIPAISLSMPSKPPVLQDRS